MNFEELTIQLLKHKYNYYILDSPTISDYDYDILERKWDKLGRELEIDMDNYPNWIGFDYKHPLAKRALEQK
jgi:NAD-dependent DNA ligase